MGDRQTLRPITTHEGKGKASRRQRIGNATCGLAAKMRVEQSAAQRPMLDGGKRVTDRACRASDGDPGVLERRDDVERDEELVLHDKNGMRIHHFITVLSFDANVAAP